MDGRPRPDTHYLNSQYERDSPGLECSEVASSQYVHHHPRVTDTAFLSLVTWTRRKTRGSNWWSADVLLLLLMGDLLRQLSSLLQARVTDPRVDEKNIHRVEGAKEYACQ